MKRIVTLLLSTSLFPLLSMAQNVGVDVAVPVQKLDVAGGIKIGNTATGAAGSLRWDGTNIQYHDGTNWIGLVANSDNQTLSIALNQLAITGGNSVDLTPYLDNTDQQNLGLTGTSLSITGGTGVDLSPLQNQLIDDDSDTKVQVEESPDEDVIRFDVAGNERWVMRGSRLENAGTGGSVFVGANAGANDDLANRRNTAVGQNALSTNASGTGNAAVGSNALIGTGSNNVAVGSNSGSGGNSNVSVGALARMDGGDGNVVVGAGAGNTSGGNNNVYIGRNAGDGGVVGHTGNGNVMLGAYQRVVGGTSNRLHIDNATTTTPLVYGEFDNNLLRVNGTLNINNAYSLPTTDGASAGYVMSTDAAGNVTWTNPGLTGDITGVIAGAGLVNGGTSGDVTIDANPDNSTIEVAADELRVKPDGITANEIAANQVGTSEIAPNAVTTDEIALNTIIAADIATGAVEADEIATGAVTTDEILNATILPIDINIGGSANQILAVNPAGTGIIWTDAGAVSNQLQDLDADTKIEVERNADEDYIRMYTSNGTNSKETITIEPADAGTDAFAVGQVGIGTNTPDRDLHIAAPAGSQLLLSRGDITTSNGDVLGELMFDSEDDSGPSSNTASAMIRGTATENHGNSNKGGMLSFYTKQNAGGGSGLAATERMRIEENGDVRIGQSATSGNDLYVNDRIIDWDNTNYYLDPAGANLVNEIQGDNGSATDPSFTFINDNNTGIYSVGGGNLGITIDGTLRADFNASGLDMNNVNIFAVNNVSTRALDSYDKLRVWNSSSYTIGMVSAQTYGYLNDYAMTFTMNNDTDRGFLWRDVSDAASDGAMSLTTDGRLTVKNTTRLQSLAGTGTRIVTADAAGVLGSSAFSGLIDVNNGLFYTGNDIRLGGSLIQNTTVTQGVYSMNFNLNSTGDFNLQDDGTIITQFRDDGVIFHGDDMYWRDDSYTGTNLMSLVDDGNDGRLQIYENGATSVDLDANSQFIFNEQGLDRNFRIESDADVFNFWSDAGLNRVGIGESAPKTKLHVEVADGQSLMLARADGSITTNEQLGGIGFDGSDGNTPDDIREASAAIIAFASETHGTGDKGGRLTFWTSPINQDDDTDGLERMRIDQDGTTYMGYDTYWRDAGIGNTNIARIVDDGNDGQMIIYENGGTSILLDANGTSVFNENSTSKDFRIESDGLDHMFFVDGSANRIGIGTTTPSHFMDIEGDIEMNVNDIWNVLEMTVSTIDDRASDIVHFDQTRVRIDVGDNDDMWFENYTGQPTMRPGRANTGFVGKVSNYHLAHYANNFNNMSQRDLKRDIRPLDENKAVEDLIIEDLSNLRPSLYKYKYETDIITQEEPAYWRPQYHLGFILDETPDYLQDNRFSGIDLYALSSMALVGAKHNLEEIEALKNGHGKRVVEDFGSATIDGETVWVEFENEFSSKLVNGEIPVVSITANALGAEIAVIEKTVNGFRVRKIGTNPLSFDWFAKAKIKSSSVSSVETGTGNTSISESVKNQLHLPQSVKDQEKMFDVYEAETQARLKRESAEDERKQREDAKEPEEAEQEPVEEAPVGAGDSTINLDDPGLNGAESPVEEKAIEATDEAETPEETIRKENAQPKPTESKAVEPSKQQSPRRN